LRIESSANPQSANPQFRNRMILEGLITTVSPAGEVNVAPMGPRVDESMRRLLLRPFQTSQTYRNLKVHGEGVFHVTDDVLLPAQAAVGTVAPPLMPATKVRGHIIRDACRYYEFRVARLDDSRERAEIEADVVASGTLREFFGFNRAKHAVLEAAILATRLHLIPMEQVRAEFARLRPPVDKTGGPREREAFEFLVRFVEGGGKPGG
jgi:hypothetical protein